MEEFKLRRASDEAPAAGAFQPVGESRYRRGSGVPRGHSLTALRKIAGKYAKIAERHS
jgi:hypothetical protein